MKEIEGKKIEREDHNLISIETLAGSLPKKSFGRKAIEEKIDNTKDRLRPETIFNTPAKFLVGIPPYPRTIESRNILGFLNHNELKTIFDVFRLNNQEIKTLSGKLEKVLKSSITDCVLNILLVLPHERLMADIEARKPEVLAPKDEKIRKGQVNTILEDVEVIDKQKEILLVKYGLIDGIPRTLDDTAEATGFKKSIIANNCNVVIERIRKQLGIDTHIKDLDKRTSPIRIRNSDIS